MGDFVKYTVVIKKRAKKFIDSLPRPDRERIVAALEKLPSEGDIKQLVNSPGLFRLRVGTYRIIYSVDHGKLLVIVIDADNRGQVYKRY